jgi:hypothetical protein
VAHGDVEAPPPAPARQRPAAGGQPEPLADAPLAAVAADDCVLEAVAFAELDRLREVARSHLHLVTVLPHRLNQRAHDEDVRAVGQVDPDAHASTTSRT